MKRILFVNACVRPESRTYILANHVLAKLDGVVEEVNLEREQIQPLNLERLRERDQYEKEGNLDAPMLRYARQFAAADEIVIAAPYWELSFPSMLRIYFEVVSVCHLSFEYSPEGAAVGLCCAKKITYVTTAGGPIGDCNLGYQYIKALAHTFYGIPEVVCFMAENLDIKGVDVKAIMEKAIEEIEQA